MLKIQNGPELLRMENDWILLVEAKLPEVLIVDILQAHNGRVVLQESELGIQWDCGRQIEREDTLPGLLSTNKNAFETELGNHTHRRNKLGCSRVKDAE